MLTKHTDAAKYSSLHKGLHKLFFRKSRWSWLLYLNTSTLSVFWHFKKYLIKNAYSISVGSHTRWDRWGFFGQRWICRHSVRWHNFGFIRDLLEIQSLWRNEWYGFANDQNVVSLADSDFIVNPPSFVDFCIVQVVSHSDPVSKALNTCYTFFPWLILSSNIPEMYNIYSLFIIVRHLSSIECWKSADKHVIFLVQTEPILLKTCTFCS